MVMDIRGQNAVITGASRGIGRATALAFARLGVNVAVTARTLSELETLVAECRLLGVKAEAYTADAADAPSVYTTCERILTHFGSVDILVNNAGVAKYGTLSEHTIADYDWMMNTNMRSTFLFTHALVPQMIVRKSGTIVIVSSQAGLAGFPNEAVYCATKHAQVGFAHALDGELRPHNVKIGLVTPGGVRTTFAFGTGRTEDMEALPHMLEAEDVADAIVFIAQQSPKSRILNIEMRPMSEKRYGGA